MKIDLLSYCSLSKSIEKKVLKKSSLKIIIQIYVPFLPLEFEPYYKMDKDPVKEQAQNPTSMDNQGRDPSDPLYCPPQALLETRDPIV